MNPLVDQLYSQLQELEPAPAPISHNSVGKRGQVVLPMPTLTPQNQSVGSSSLPPPEKKKREDDRMIQPDDLLAADVLVEHETGRCSSFEEFINLYLSENSKTFLRIKDSLITCTPAGQILNPVNTEVPISSREVILVNFPPSARFLLALKETSVIFSSRVLLDVFIRDALMKTRQRLSNIGIRATTGDEGLNNLAQALLARCNIETYCYV